LADVRHGRPTGRRHRLRLRSSGEDLGPAGPPRRRQGSLRPHPLATPTRPPSRRDPKASHTIQILEAHDITKSYGSGESYFEALKGVSIAVAAGESVAIV